MNRKSLLSALCLLGGAALIAVGWWDFQNSDVIHQWWAGEQIYPFYWVRLARTLAFVLPLVLLAWWLGVKARASSGPRRKLESEEQPAPVRTQSVMRDQFRQRCAW